MYPNGRGSQRRISQGFDGGRQKKKQPVRGCCLHACLPAYHGERAGGLVVVSDGTLYGGRSAIIACRLYRCRRFRVPVPFSSSWSSSSADALGGRRDATRAGLSANGRRSPRALVVRRRRTPPLAQGSKSRSSSSRPPSIGHVPQQQVRRATARTSVFLFLPRRRRLSPRSRGRSGRTFVGRIVPRFLA